MTATLNLIILAASLVGALCLVTPFIISLNRADRAANRARAAIAALEAANRPYASTWRTVGDITPADRINVEESRRLRRLV